MAVGTLQMLEEPEQTPMHWDGERRGRKGKEGERGSEGERGKRGKEGEREGIRI